MKVLHLIDHFGVGGAQTVVKGILTIEKEQDCFAIRNKENQNITTENVYFSKSKLKLNIMTLFKIKKLTLQNEYPILHCHLFAGYLYGYFLKRLWFPTIALIFHEHGRIFRNNWFYNFYLKHTQNKIDLFIAVSETTKRKLMKTARIPEEKMKVLYNFVDLENFNPEVLKEYDRDREREKLGINSDDFVIGFAGRLSKVKGCEYLIKSIPYINIPNFKVLIAGDGPEREKLERLVENLNVKEKTVFLGYVRDILNFYRMIDVLVVPSKFEASPMIFYESQALGISIIASDVGALNELIKNEENGLSFEFANEKDLAEKIELMEKDQDLREKLIKNGLYSVKRYSLEDYIRGLEEIYEVVRYENK